MTQDILSVATRQNFKRRKTLSEKSFYHRLSIIFTVEDRKFSKKKDLSDRNISIRFRLMF